MSPAARHPRMTEVTGPSAKLLDRREELTPMLAQYVDLAEAYDDAVVLFRVGDFYKTFCETADEVARVCELTRIEREDSTGTYTAAGIPVDNAATYLERLLDAGYRLAVADQVEDPEETTGLVDRAVTQVVTPGTVVDEELLDAGTSNYVAAVVGPDEADDGATDTGAGPDSGPPAPDRYAVAHVDVSTGECAVTATADRAAVAEELDRLAPAELLVGPGGDALATPDGPPTTESEAAEFAPDAAREALADYAAPERFDDAEIRAVGGLLGYAEYTQGGEALSHVTRVRRYDPRETLRLDAAAIESLELFENRGRGASETLLSVLDETACALGRRRLERRLRRPFADRDRVVARHDAVAELRERSLLRESIRESLSAAYDLERLVGRVARERATARDLRSLHETLAVVPELRDALTDAEADRLRALRDDLDPLADVRDLVETAVVPDPPQEVTEGGVIREGFDADLDDLRATEREGREWVADLQARERERTGIDNLDVGHNSVHGYYIEVTDGQLEKVPEDYRRRQTLKNSERFVTPELRRREDEILGASERADDLEYELFAEVRASVAAESERIQALSETLATLDVLATFAAVAAARDYCRPRFHEDGTGEIDLAGGRHPVVERTTSAFVPNDAALPRGGLAVVTGPNMSGKSTYMRSVALAVVMAQAGSFVAADAATLPVVDRVFTRVGASDDIAGGESTFMREMRELSTVLHDATPDSLVLLDEVGRGTATADGFAIARAAAEFVHDEVGATTLFATHYHELTDLAADRERAFNLHFAATHREDAAPGEPEVTFLHRVREGAADSSYGVDVASMAGVPEPVLVRARGLVGDDAGADAQRTLPEIADLAAAENGHAADRRTNGEATATDPGNGAEPATNGSQAADSTDDSPDRPPGDLPVDRPAASPAERAALTEIRDLDVADTTPIEALTLLHDLRERLATGDRADPTAGR
ncbi:MAG: DNA mismatch repair protein MutS [Halolamina sp.]